MAAQAAHEHGLSCTRRSHDGGEPTDATRACWHVQLRLHVVFAHLHVHVGEGDLHATLRTSPRIAKGFAIYVRHRRDTSSFATRQGSPKNRHVANRERTEEGRVSKVGRFSEEARDQARWGGGRHECKAEWVAELVLMIDRQHGQRWMDCIHAKITCPRTVMQERGREPWKRGSKLQAWVRVRETSPSGRRCRNKGNDLISMSIHTKLAWLHPALGSCPEEPPVTSSCVWQTEKVLTTGSNQKHA
mmetsp:Transcript_9696/g.58719  ORF Transcript_9696/g.58719 Transcript_9696/m.58719 type:complete len:245 (+) Transcript_9696:4120-4854(+)